MAKKQTIVKFPEILIVTLFHVTNDIYFLFLQVKLMWNVLTEQDKTHVTAIKYIFYFFYI